MRHKPWIDGLRNIEVIPVVLFHTGLSGFSGGSICVDIFFLMSGFLPPKALLRRFQIVESRSYDFMSTGRDASFRRYFY